MGSLSQGVLKTVKIPIPPANVQEKIVKEVRERGEKAKRLKEETKQLLEKAKREVENIILGAE
jgi:restriction endonuclease S subunit